MDTIKRIVAYLPTVGILVAILALPFPYGALQRYGLIFGAAGFLTDYIWNRRWESWHWTSAKWVYIAFLAFYACLPLRELFSPEYNWLFHTKLETYMPFLVFGVMGIMGFNETQRPELVTGSMALSCVYMGVVLVHAMWGVPYTGFAEWQEQLKLIRDTQLNTHMVVNVYCNMALVFIGWVLLVSSCKKWYKWVLGIVAVGIIGGLLISEGRIGQMTLFVLLPLFVAAWFHKCGKLKWIVPMFATIALAAGLFLHFAPRFHHPSLYDNARPYIWRVAWSMVEEKPIFGWGVSTARDEFVRRGLEDSNFQIHYVEEFKYVSNEAHGVVKYQIMHPHNAFLETWMEMGVTGLLLFVLCIILPIYLLPIGHNRWYLAACLFVFCMQAMFETMGACLFPIWIPILVYIWQNPLRNDRSLFHLSDQS